jgi:DNA-directed RNA polymerase specialized sigma24 family protein
MRRDFWTRVRALLRVFTADQQELFLRYHVRQQSLMDLAERDGRSLHALHQSLHNVHRRLARLLIEQGWDAAEVRQLFGAPTPQPVSRPRTCGNPPSQL